MRGYCSAGKNNPAQQVNFPGQYNSFNKFSSVVSSLK